MGLRQRLVLFSQHYLATDPNSSVGNTQKFDLDNIKAWMLLRFFGTNLSLGQKLNYVLNQYKSPVLKKDSK